MFQSLPRQLSGGSSDAQQQLAVYAIECVKPGLQYLSDIFLVP